MEFDCIIIGGGVIGLALAAKLAPSQSVLLLEQHGLFASETSSRNSEVIHAGLYYPSGSLKESLCIKGREQLYAYAQKHHIALQKVGKLIVSQQPDCPKLAELQHKAQHLDISLERLSRKQTRAFEPNVQAQDALFSPNTGIIDSHALMQALIYDSEQAGGLLVKNSQFQQAQLKPDGFDVQIATADGTFYTQCRTLINAAGLYASEVAKRIEFSPRDMPQTLYCRGRYFSYQGKAPFTHLIYPLPEENLKGLGIHATLDLAGQVRFGPDAEYISDHQTHQYQTDGHLKSQFAQAIKHYFPALDVERLQADYTGIRPKLSAQGQAGEDFKLHIQQESNAQLIELFGIESPGLTAALALADAVQKRMS